MSLFEEVNKLLDTKQDQMAQNQYDELYSLYTDNYNYIEGNDAYFNTTYERFTKYIDKLRENMEKNNSNIDKFRKAYEFGSIIHSKDRFRNLNTDKFYKEQGKLPKWFDDYKMDQLDKARDYINSFALRSYRNRVNETVMAERKSLEKKVNQKIDEILRIYTFENKLEPPIIKIQELQHSIEQLQEYDRIIPELVIVVMHKVDESCSIIVRNYLEFQSKCDNLFK